MVVYLPPITKVLGLQLPSRMSYASIYATASLDVQWIVQESFDSVCFSNLKAQNNKSDPRSSEIDLNFLKERLYCTLLSFQWFLSLKHYVFVRTHLYLTAGIALLPTGPVIFVLTSWLWKGSFSRCACC